MHIVQQQKSGSRTRHTQNIRQAGQVKLRPKETLKQIPKQHTIYPWQAKFSSNSHDKQILPQNAKGFKHCRACTLSISISTTWEKSPNLFKHAKNKPRPRYQSISIPTELKRRTWDSSERAKPMGMKSPTSPSIDSRNCKEERAYLVNHLKGRPQMHQERREVGAGRRVVGAGRRVVGAKRISYLLFHVTISFSTIVDLIIYATSWPIIAIIPMFFCAAFGIIIIFRHT